VKSVLDEISPVVFSYPNKDFTRHPLVGGAGGPSSVSASNAYYGDCSIFQVATVNAQSVVQFFLTMIILHTLLCWIYVQVRW